MPLPGVWCAYLKLLQVAAPSLTLAYERLEVFSFSPGFWF
jgi:hypothetical protein